MAAPYFPISSRLSLARKPINKLAVAIAFTEERAMSDVVRSREEYMYILSPCRLTSFLVRVHPFVSRYAHTSMKNEVSLFFLSSSSFSLYRSGYILIYDLNQPHGTSLPSPLSPPPPILTPPFHLVSPPPSPLMFCPCITDQEKESKKTHKSLKKKRNVG